MKEAIFLTFSPIDPQKCKVCLSKYRNDVNGNEVVVSFGKEQKSMYIWFPSISCDSENEHFIYEDVANMPAAVLYGTHLEYHREVELKETIFHLLEIYPELCIIDDDDIVKRAEDYLNKNGD